LTATLLKRPSSRHPALRVLGNPGYRRLVGAGMLYSLGQLMEQITVGWFVLQTTGSVFLTALAWAVRALPNLLFGSIGGAIADRYARNRVLAVTAVVRALNVCAMAAVVLLGDGQPLLILCLVAVSGLGNAAQLASTQALAADNAEPRDLAHAISTLSFAARSMGAVGVLASGFVLAALGSGWTLLLACAPMLGAAVLFGSVPSKPGSGAARSGNLLSDVVEGFQALSRISSVTRLLALMAVTEILGFSYSAFMPVIADHILGLGAEGLGALLSAAALGSMTGVGVLSIVPVSGGRGRLLLVVVVVFGLLVAALPWSTLFALSLGLVALIGAAAALIDTVQHSLLQRSVDNHLRGRVLGAWNVAIGLGVLGPVLLGALAERIGVAPAMGIAGVCLALIGGLCFFSGPLRRLDEPS
jgi:MFS family permease